MEPLYITRDQLKLINQMYLRAGMRVKNETELWLTMQIKVIDLVPMDLFKIPVGFFLDEKRRQLYEN